MNFSGPADDRLALRQLVEQYFYGVDHNAPTAVADCFSENCFFQINVEPPITLRGRDSVRTMFSENVLFVASNHAVSHHTIQVDEGRLIGTTYAVAHVVLRPAESHRLLVRGLRYDDEYVREDGRWLITRRIHNPLWQYEAVITPLGLA